MTNEQKIKKAYLSPSTFGPKTVDYAVPYQWANNATKEQNKWGHLQWDACAGVYFSLFTNNTVWNELSLVSGQNNTLEGNGRYLEGLLNILEGKYGVNYLRTLETSCNKPLFLHPAIDYGTSQKIRSIAPGIVKRVIDREITSSGFKGRAVLIEHNLTCTTNKVTKKIIFYGAYYHLDRLTVKEGQGVSAGSIIAETTYFWPKYENGNRHLHLEIHSGDTKGSLFDKWPQNSDVKINFFELVYETSITKGTTLKDLQNSVTANLEAKQNNVSLFAKAFDGISVKYTADEKIVSGKGSKLNSDSFAKNLFLIAKAVGSGLNNFRQVLEALNTLPRFKGIYTNVANYSGTATPVKMPAGYIDPETIGDTIEKQLVQK